MSEISKSATRNVAVLTLTRIITWTSTFLLMMFLPRYLGPVDYGRYYLGQSIVAMFALFIEFGGNYSITKAVSRARDEAGHIIVNAISIRGILWLLSFIGVITYALLVNYHSSVKIIIMIFGVGMLWSGARSVIWSAFGGFEMLKYPSYGAIAETVFIASVGITAVVLGVGPIGFAVITILGTLLNFIICLKFIRKMAPILPKIDWKAARKSLKDSLPYFLNSVFGVIYYRIDTVMLSFMAPERVVGWYAASYRFFETLMFVPSIFTIAIFPIMSRLWGEDNKSLGRPLQKSLDFIFLSGVPLSVGAFAFSHQIIQFFYGIEAYQQSVMLLMIFGAGILLFYIDIMLGTILLASDKHKQLTVNAFIAIFVNVALNYFLIPYTQTHFGNGGIGSAIATLVTELFVMVAMLSIIQKDIFKDSNISVQLKALFSGCLMALALWFMRSLDTPIILQGCLSGVVYIAILFITRAITSDDMALIGHLIPDRFRKIKETQE
ncbi:MAG: flippase [Bacteroidota bacterium]|nr:flippase [Bacteroidota bacterium]